MTAVAFKPPPAALAVLAVAALYYLSRQKSAFASKSQTATTSNTAKLYRGTVFNALPNAGNGPGTAAAQQASGNASNPLAAGLGFFGSLVNALAGNSAPLSPWSASVPTYMPDGASRAGETAASKYYNANSDNFASSAPAEYQYNDGVDPNNVQSYLDNQ